MKIRHECSNDRCIVRLNKNEGKGEQNKNVSANYVALLVREVRIGTQSVLNFDVSRTNTYKYVTKQVSRLKNYKVHLVNFNQLDGRINTIFNFRKTNILSQVSKSTGSSNSIKLIFTVSSDTAKIYSRERPTV